MAQGAKYKNVGGPHFRPGADGGQLIRKGEIFEATDDEVRAFPEKFQKVSGGPPPEPTKAEDASQSEVDVQQYHVGGNVYEIPGVGRVRGKNKALAALLAAAEDADEDDEDDEE